MFFTTFSLIDVPQSKPLRIDHRGITIMNSHTLTQGILDWIFVVVFNMRLDLHIIDSVSLLEPQVVFSAEYFNF